MSDELFVVTRPSSETREAAAKTASAPRHGTMFCGVFYNPLEIIYDAQTEGREAFLARIAETNRKRETRDLRSPLAPIRLKEFK